MKTKPTYVVLAMCSTGWEANGPIATEYRTLKEAEAAAHGLSARYPHKTLGVYELRSVLGTQQKVVKQRVESEEQSAKARAVQQAGNVLKIRA